MRVIFYCLVVLSVMKTLSGAQITYEFSGGRFGDCLMAYLHAKWLSYKQGIPLLYKPFEYSHQLVLDTVEPRFTGFTKPGVMVDKAVHVDSRNECIYVVPYFSEVEYERNLPWNSNWIYFAVDWQDKGFKGMIQQLIAPKDQSAYQFTLPTDCVTVAVHVRKGGGFDNPLLCDTQTVDPRTNLSQTFSDYYAPLKFPPEYFYTDALKRLVSIVGNVPLYVYIFTDDPHPENIASRFAQELSDHQHIHFDYRAAGNAHNANVLHDFFAMTRFDCIIHPLSNFSLVASKLGSYRVQIYPTKHHWEGTRSVIDDVAVILNDAEAL